MKRSLLLLAVILCTFTVSAKMQNVVAIYQNDGLKVRFAFSDQPKVTYSDNEVRLKSATNTISYAVSSLKKVAFEKVNLWRIIGEMRSDERFTFRDDSIVVDGGEPNSLVNIYNESGRLVGLYRLNNDGKAIIPTQALRGATYTVQAKGFTFKMTK